MDIKLTQTQFDVFKAGLVTTSFEMLDVNDDNQITDADLTAAQDATVKKDIQELLKKKDEDTELKTFDLDEVNALLKTQEAGANAAATATGEAGATAEAAGAEANLPLDIEGYENVDISNIATETEAQIQEKLTKIENNIKLINEKLTALKAEKEENEKKLEELEADKKLKEDALKAAKDDVTAKETALDDEIKSYDDIKEELESVNNRIRIQQNLEEEKYEEHIGNISKKASQNYNPEEHGDNFESYFLKELAKAGYTVFSGLTSLNETAEDLSENARNTIGRIQVQSAALSGAIRNANLAQTALDDVNADIQEVKDKIAQNTEDIDAATDMLQAEEDKKADVQERWNAIQAKKCDPLAFDIDGDGIKTTNQKVSFDIDGDGQKDIVNDSAEWTLAFDKDKDGIAGEDGSELFGDNTDFDGDGVKDGYKDGFDALKSLAEKEGLISANDSVLDSDDLAKLSEKYGLVMKKGYVGETKSLSELGVTQINISTSDQRKTIENFDGRNNDLTTQEGATFVVNGQTRDYADIWNKKYDENTVAKSGSNDVPTVKNEAIKSEKNIFAKSSSLVFNLSDTQAQKGKVDYEKIQLEAFNKRDIPDALRKKLKEEPEEEQK